MKLHRVRRPKIRVKADLAFLHNAVTFTVTLAVTIAGGLLLVRGATC